MKDEVLALAAGVVVEFDFATKSASKSRSLGDQGLSSHARTPASVSKARAAGIRATPRAVTGNR